MSERWRFRLVLFGCLVGGVILIAVPWDAVELNGYKLWKPTSHVLGAVGDALLVAAILAVLVDEAAKRKLLREFASDVSAHIIGRKLPLELRNHLGEYLEGDLVRSVWEIRYTISDWEGRADFEKLTTEIDYTIQNRSGKAKEYPFIYEMEKSFWPNISQAKITHVACTNLVDPDVEAFAQVDPPVQETAKDITFLKVVSIPAHDGDAYSFSVQSVEVFRDGSLVPFFAKVPVLATTLTVKYPRDRIRVFVDLSFGDLAADARHEPLSDCEKWIFKRPLLPGQGFTIRFQTLGTAVTEPAMVGAATIAAPATTNPAGQARAARAGEAPTAPAAAPPTVRLPPPPEPQG